MPKSKSPWLRITSFKGLNTAKGVDDPAMAKMWDKELVEWQKANNKVATKQEAADYILSEYNKNFYPYAEIVEKGIDSSAKLREKLSNDPTSDKFDKSQREQFLEFYKNIT